MNSPAFGTTRARLNLSSIVENSHKGTVTIIAKVASHILKRYALDAVIAKNNKKKWSSKLGSVVP